MPESVRLPYAKPEDAQAVRAWVMSKWAVDDEPARNIWPFAGGEWLTYMAQSLNQEFQAHVSYILSDVWHSIAIDVYPNHHRVTVHCDRVEDGLFALWKHLYEATA